MACANSAPRPASGQVHSISGRFAQIELPIIRDKRLTDTDIRILTTLLAHRNAQHGKAWPKRETIAEIVGCHVETVSRSTARLIACGWLVKVADGRGRGHVAVFTFPLADQRQAQRQAVQGQAAPKAKTRKARAERKPNPPAGFCGPLPYRTEVFEKNLPQTPSGDPAPAGMEAPCGEFLATHSQNLETPCAGLRHDSASEPGIAQQEPGPTGTLGQQQATPHQQGALEAPRGSKAPKPTQPHRLAFPEALPALLCVHLGRMLASTPEAVAQEILDEMAFNARCHAINSPGGYIRRLLNLHRRGEFEPEVAHFERERRERIAANQRAQQNAERRHLEALSQGRLPESPSIVIERTAADEAQATQALAQAKLAARGALLSPEQREQARLAYLASKGPQRPAAPTTAPPHQGEEEDAAGMAFFAAIKASLKPQAVGTNNPV